jgi:quercetin 2,3-dioxygenase
METPGKIFLSDQRGLTQTPQHCRYSTFNCGDFNQEHRTPFGSLYGLHEEWLTGQHGLDLPVAQASYLLLLPVTGALECGDPDGNITTVEVEEVLVCELPAHSSATIRNPYESDVIHFIQIWIKAGKPAATASTRVLPFHFASPDTSLAEIISPGSAHEGHQLPFSLSIGRFAGRQEAVYTLKSKASRFFAYVLAGAFECEGRLLHQNDGLALWDTEAVELEALSNNALVLILALAESGSDA